MIARMLTKLCIVSHFARIPAVPLVNALFTNSVEWVREYHPPFWEFADGEDDGTLPCIEEIVIENAPMNPRAEAVGRENSAS